MLNKLLPAKTAKALEIASAVVKRGELGWAIKASYDLEDLQQETLMILAEKYSLQDCSIQLCKKIMQNLLLNRIKIHAGMIDAASESVEAAEELGMQLAAEPSLSDTNFLDRISSELSGAEAEILSVLMRRADDGALSVQAVREVKELGYAKWEHAIAAIESTRAAVSKLL